jgi:hypothetical protein
MFQKNEILNYTAAKTSELDYTKTVRCTIIRRDAVELLQTRKWKAAARDRESWRKEIGEVMAR